MIFKEVQRLPDRFLALYLLLNGVTLDQWRSGGNGYSPEAPELVSAQRLIEIPEDEYIGGDGQSSLIAERIQHRAPDAVGHIPNGKWYLHQAFGVMTVDTPSKEFSPGEFLLDGELIYWVDPISYGSCQPPTLMQASRDRVGITRTVSGEIIGITCQ